MEHSPSGKGLHIFFKATGYNFDKTKYNINNRKLGVEVYVAGTTNRFVTVTGNVFAGGDIAEKSNELQMILDKYMLRPTPVKQILDRESQSYLSDKSVIEKALKSANGERFNALWQGDTSGYALPVKLIWHFAVCWHFGVAEILDRWTDFSGRAV